MESIWTHALDTSLRSLWDAGLSTAEIGRSLGVSKNAVVGRAHRLALTPRPSPIKRKLEAAA
jgi:GcrA cell cycle regulator